MSIRGFVFTLALAATTLSAAAQQPPAQPSPAFRLEVNYVEIDAIVTDEKGNFVRGLTKDDFELVEEGRPQSISAFTVVDVPIRKPDPPLFKGAPVEPDVASNDSDFNGRVIVLMLDDMLTDARRSVRVRNAAKQFVQRFVNDNDLVAVVHTSASASTGQNFTNNRQRLLASIDKFVGRRLQSAAQSRLDAFERQRAAAVQIDPRDATDPDALERASRSRAALERLTNASEFLANIRGRRKALLWFSEGLDGDVQNPTDSSMTIVRESMRDLVGAAQRAGVAFYAIDPRGVGAGMDDALMMGSPVNDPTGQLGMADMQGEVQRAQLTLRSISQQTGGFAVVGGQDLSEQFAKIIEENSSYYLLGYYPTEDKRDGKFRRVEVRVKRPGLRIRHRAGYAAPKGKAPQRAASSSEKSAPPELRAAIENPLPMAGLSMRVFAAPFAASGNKAAVAIAIEVDPSALRFQEGNGTFNEDLEFIVVPINASGKALDGTRDEAPLRLSARSHELIKAHGFRTVRRLDLPPGRYQLRVAGKSKNANLVGAVTYDLDVPDFSKAPLAMSGIALMTPSADRMPTPRPSQEFMDVLPMAVTAIRDFPRSDTLFVFADVYTRQAGTPHAVQITTTVTSDAGAVVFTGTDERRTEEIKAKTGGFGHSVKIPLSALAPGRYVLKIEARAQITNGTTVAREVEFTVTDKH